MKNLILTLSLSLACCGLFGSSVYFDLGDYYTVSGNWNTVSSWQSGVQVINAIDSQGNATSVSLNCADGFAMYNSSGEAGVTAYPAEAGKDSFYISSTDSYAEILIGGLTAGESYDFKFFGSRASSGPRALNISIGDETVYLDAAYNTSNVVSIEGVAADSAGLAVIGVSLAPNSSYGYLGVIEIIGEFDEPVVDEPGIFVAPWGSDSNPGTMSWPKKTFPAARDAVRDYIQANGLPEEGLDVYFRGGTYYFNNTVYLGPEDSGTENSRIVYRSYPGEEAIFDGSLVIPADSFYPVTDPSVLARLNPNVQSGTIMATSISDSALIDALSDKNAPLSFNGEAIKQARWPNDVYAHIDQVLDPGAIYVPGRTPGDPPEYDIDNPVGGIFTVREQWSGDWAAEYENIKKAQFHGFEHHDWWISQFTVASVNENDEIQLMEYSRYGVEDAYPSLARRFYVSNLLCELDAPGEWYFDEQTNVFYIYPPEVIDSSTNLSVWQSPSFIEMTCSNVTLENLTFQGATQWTFSGSGMLNITGGENNLIAGCTIRNSTRTGVAIIGGSNNGLVSCDVYDVRGHLSLDGGDIATLTPAGNYAINNNFTSIYNDIANSSTIRIKGVGQIFKNNLVHNIARAWSQMHGNNHIFEFNELFYTGYELGDGSCFSPGSMSMMSYGSCIRNNFFHHIYSWPGAHARGAVYPDHLGAGQNIEGNVFYKAGHRSVLLNGGAGNRVVDNYYIDGNIGIYQTSVWAQRSYDAYLEYKSGAATASMPDYAGMVEDVIGVDSWNNEPWISTFPKFARIMNQEQDRFWPIETVYQNNLFCDMTQKMLFRWDGWGDDYITDDMSHPEAVPYITESGTQEITYDVFENPDTMNFQTTSSALPQIPFDNIGLYVDGYRKYVPDKGLYRSLVKQHWSDRPAWDENLVYDPNNIDWLYYNTGELLIDMGKAGDLNRDTKVDLIDFAKLSDCWHESNFSGSAADCNKSDIDFNGQVDLVDLRYLVENWLNH
jgi:hypothetical protein